MEMDRIMNLWEILMEIMGQIWEAVGWISKEIMIITVQDSMGRTTKVRFSLVRNNPHYYFWFIFLIQNLSCLFHFFQRLSIQSMESIMSRKLNIPMSSSQQSSQAANSMKLEKQMDLQRLLAISNGMATWVPHISVKITQLLKTI